MRGRQWFAIAKPGLLMLGWLIKRLPAPLRKLLLLLTRGWPGVIGVGIRYALLNALGCATKPNVAVLGGVYLGHVEGISIGQNVSIHPMCYIDGWGGVDIGDDVSIAHGVTIMSTNHKFERTDIPIRDQGVTGGLVEIGDDCWIGAQAVILAGVTIGSGSVIAANAVVTRDVPAFAVVAGSPAKIIRDRGDSNSCE